MPQALLFYSRESTGKIQDPANNDQGQDFTAQSPSNCNTFPIVGHKLKKKNKIVSPNETRFNKCHEEEGLFLTLVT